MARNVVSKLHNRAIGEGVRRLVRQVPVTRLRAYELADRGNLVVFGHMNTGDIEFARFHGFKVVSIAEQGSPAENRPWATDFHFELPREKNRDGDASEAIARVLSELGWEPVEWRSKDGWTIM